MAEYVKEVITRQVNPVSNIQTVASEPKATSYQTIEYLVYFFFGLLEVLLGFRFILKLAGANYTSGFVDFIYKLTGAFTLPFNGIFSTEVSKGLETNSILEPSTIVALIVYALVAIGIVQLIRVFSGRQQVE